MDDSYRSKIEECVSCDKLTDWERNFMDSVKGRTNLSMGQKRVVDNIYATRIEGKEVDRRRKIVLKHGIVDATKDDTGFVITVGGHKVGFGVTMKEAGLIAPWLAAALKDLLAIPKSEIKTEKEETEEDPEPEDPEPEEPAELEEF